MRRFVVLLPALCCLACAPSAADSSFKVATATTAAAPTSSAAPTPETGYIDCVGAPIIKPASIHLDCIDNKAQIKQIKWKSWKPKEAIGEGVLQGTKTTVSVVLSEPIADLSGQKVFSLLSVDGELTFP